MKKYLILFCLFFSLCFGLSAQNVLHNYHGFWNKHKISIFELLEENFNQLPFLRNEIYARYGRPFVNKVYQDYFNKQPWYEKRPDFKDSWLSVADRENAALILSLEQPKLSPQDTVTKVLQNIEYKSDEMILTFISKTEVAVQDFDTIEDFYGINRNLSGALSWFVFGDWIISYEKYPIHMSNHHTAIAYKLDHQSNKILKSVKNMIHNDTIEKLTK